MIFAIRTRRVPFFRSRPSKPLTVTTLTCVAIGALLPFSPAATFSVSAPSRPRSSRFLAAWCRLPGAHRARQASLLSRCPPDNLSPELTRNGRSTTVPPAGASPTMLRPRRNAYCAEGEAIHTPRVPTRPYEPGGKGSARGEPITAVVRLCACEKIPHPQPLAMRSGSIQLGRK